MVVLQLLVVGLFTTLAAAYARFLWNRRRLYYLAAKLEGPRGLPFIGMGHKFIEGNCKKIFEFFITVTDGYKSPVGAWLGPELLIFADTPESLQIVLNSPKCLDKSPLYDRLLLTKGLVLAGGELWKNHRKILNPAFNLSVLQKLIPTFDEKSKIFVKNLETKVGQNQFDVFTYMSACSLETLLKGTMGVDRDIQTDPLNNHYMHHAEM